jgi:hypothetical protein
VHGDNRRRSPDGSPASRLKEYVRGPDYSNTVENVFSVFKRGVRGIYQHCGSQQLRDAAGVVVYATGQRFIAAEK